MYTLTYPGRSIEKLTLGELFRSTGKDPRFATLDLSDISLSHVSFGRMDVAQYGAQMAVFVSNSALYRVMKGEYADVLFFRKGLYWVLHQNDDTN